MAENTNEESRTVERGNTKVTGEVDAGFNSYGVPEQESEEATTVGGTTEEDFGELSTVAIPSEALGKDLTEKEINVIEKAVLNVDSSLATVADKSGVSEGSVYRYLTRIVPDWYENTFKQRGTSVKYSQTGGMIEEEDPGVEYQKPMTDETILRFVRDHEEPTAALLNEKSDLSQHSSAWERLNDKEEEGLLTSYKDGGKRIFEVVEEEVENSQGTEEEQVDEPEGVVEGKTFLSSEEVTLYQIRAVCEYSHRRSHSPTLEDYLLDLIEDAETTQDALHDVEVVVGLESSRHTPHHLAEHVIDLLNSNL